MTTFNPPALLKCRWDDGMAQVVEPDGRVVNYGAYILLDSEVREGDLLFKLPKGVTLDYLRTALGVQYPTVPSIKQGSREVKKYRNTIGFKGELTLVEVWV